MTNPEITRKMNPIELIEKYYDNKSELYKILFIHSSQVRDKALEVAARHPDLGADTQFIAEASMLHDIGIYLTNAPEIECFGKHEYIEHGYLGSDLLRREGFPNHALVCERHTGAGLTLDWILEKELPLPHRDMFPVSIEEKIICYADKFFSKSKPDKELSVEKIIRKLGKYTEQQVEIFSKWHNEFS